MVAQFRKVLEATFPPNPDPSPWTNAARAFLRHESTAAMVAAMFERHSNTTERAACETRLRAIPLDALRSAGMQDDASHEAMRALFVAALDPDVVWPTEDDD